VLPKTPKKTPKVSRWSSISKISELLLKSLMDFLRAANVLRV
jgi:hypothetical protein